MYSPPYTIEEIKKYYPDKAKMLLNDPVHLWRATTGIELIHKEPSIDEQLRIWENWNQMTFAQKKISDQKSFEIFGMNNADHHKDIMKNK